MSYAQYLFLRMPYKLLTQPITMPYTLTIRTLTTPYALTSYDPKPVTIIQQPEHFSIHNLPLQLTLAITTFYM